MPFLPCPVNGRTGSRRGVLQGTDGLVHLVHVVPVGSELAVVESEIRFEFIDSFCHRLHVGASRVMGASICAFANGRTQVCALDGDVDAVGTEIVAQPESSRSAAIWFWRAVIESDIPFIIVRMLTTSSAPASAAAIAAGVENSATERGGEPTLCYQAK